MPTKYRLHYYSGKGRGEIVRQMLTMGGVEFEDIRYEHDEWIEKYKPISPFGQCPFLEIDDGKEKVVLCQSHAIARYLARMWGFNGDSLLDQCKVEMIGDSVSDYIVQPCVWIRREKDEEKKAEKVKKYVEEELPTALKNFEKHLLMNNNGDSYFVGNTITWADMLFTHWMLWLPNGVKVTPPLDKYPKLKALTERVQANPKIAAWMKKRPVTEL